MCNKTLKLKSENSKTKKKSFLGSFVQKCFAQYFSNYCLSLQFFGRRMLVRKLLIKCQWNRLPVSISSTFYSKFFAQKCFAQLSSNYCLALLFFGKRISSKILLVKCWRNWLQERTNPSLAWLMPKEMMWGPDEVFLQSDNLNVTTKNFEQV